MSSQSTQGSFQQKRNPSRRSRGSNDSVFLHVPECLDRRLQTQAHNRYGVNLGGFDSTSLQTEHAEVGEEPVTNRTPVLESAVGKKSKETVLGIAGASKSDLDSDCSLPQLRMSSSEPTVSRAMMNVTKGSCTLAPQYKDGDGSMVDQNSAHAYRFVRDSAGNIIGRVSCSQNVADGGGKLHTSVSHVASSISAPESESIHAIHRKASCRRGSSGMNRDNPTYRTAPIASRRTRPQVFERNDQRRHTYHTLNSAGRVMAASSTSTEPGHMTRAQNGGTNNPDPSAFQLLAVLDSRSAPKVPSAYEKRSNNSVNDLNQKGAHGRNERQQSIVPAAQPTIQRLTTVESGQRQHSGHLQSTVYATSHMSSHGRIAAPPREGEYDNEISLISQARDRAAPMVDQRQAGLTHSNNKLTFMHAMQAFPETLRNGPVILSNTRADWKPLDAIHNTQSTGDTRTTAELHGGPQEHRNHRVQQQQHMDSCVPAMQYPQHVNPEGGNRTHNFHQVQRRSHLVPPQRMQTHVGQAQVATQKPRQGYRHYSPSLETVPEIALRPTVIANSAARMVSSFSRHQLQLAAEAYLQGCFLDRSLDLRQSNRRYSFTAAVAPEELISSLNIADIGSSPVRASIAAAPVPSSDVDTDRESLTDGTSLVFYRPRQSSGSTAVRRSEICSGTDDSGIAVGAGYDFSSRRPSLEVQTRPTQGVRDRKLERMSSDSAIQSTAVNASRNASAMAHYADHEAGRPRIASRAGSNDPPSPVPRAGSLMRAITGEDENSFGSMKHPPPTLSTYKRDGCGVGTQMCCRWFFSWPIGGERGRLLTRFIMCILAWTALATITGDIALPGPKGYLFGLSVVIAAAALGGYLVRLLHLPPLLGMLLAGFLLRNIGVVDVPATLAVVNANASNSSNLSSIVAEAMSSTSASSLTSNLRSSWSSALRSVALVIILLRAGLGLDPAVLRKAKFVILRLAFLPCLVEASIDAVFAVVLLDFSWAWGYILGFVIAAVSPAVVVPSLLGLQDKGYGVAKGIPTLVIAAASFDDVIAISGFGIALGLVFSTGGSLALNIVRGPLELVAGIGGGTLVGIVAWYIPSSDKSQGHLYRNRVIFLLLAGLTAVFGTRLVHFTGAGALGTLVMAFVAGRKWSNENRIKVARAFALLWHFAQPMLFGLIGAEIDSAILGESFVGKAIGILWLGMLFRVMMSLLSVVRYDLNIKEKVFVALAWLPKATVQAAIGSLALDTATEQGGTPEQIRLGKMVLTIAVLVIVFTAPVGSIAISLSGPKLLVQSKGDGAANDMAAGSGPDVLQEELEQGPRHSVPTPHQHESAV